MRQRETGGRAFFQLSRMVARFFLSGISQISLAGRMLSFLLFSGLHRSVPKIPKSQSPKSRNPKIRNPKKQKKSEVRSMQTLKKQKTKYTCVLLGCRTVLFLQSGARRPRRILGGLTGQRVGFKACLPVMADAGLCFIRRASLATLPACQTCQCLLRVGAATTNFCESRLTGSHATDCEPEICVRFEGSCYR